jgi:hypothetical protein
MVELEFNPQTREVVIGPPSDQSYEVVDRRTSAVGELLLDLKRLKDGAVFKNVSAIWFQYPLADRVERAVRQLLLTRKDFPRDLQEGRFKVATDTMFDGTPRIAVYFYVRPEAISTQENARVRNDFYSALQTEINPLMDEGVWLQFMTKEDRSALLAAS